MMKKWPAQLDEQDGIYIQPRIVIRGQIRGYGQSPNPFSQES